MYLLDLNVLQTVYGTTSVNMETYLML